MADPFQILAQQASQTANLFQAIDKNTQQMFQNKFSVQEAESRLALNTMQLTEQSRVNDAKIESYNQEMKIRQKEMEWQQADRAVRDRFLPLKEQAERVRLESSIQANTAARIAPQFDDLRPEIAQVIFDNPELADEIQREYSKSMTLLTQDALNPNVDVVKRVNEEKVRIKSLVDEKRKKSEFKKNTFGPPDVTKSDWLTNKFGENPNRPVDAARAADIYEFFGGDKLKFGIKNDPDVKTEIESAARHAKMTGKVDPKMMPLFSKEDQMEIFKVQESKQRQDEILSAAKSLNDQLETIRSMAKDSGVEGKYDTEANVILTRQAELMKEYTKLSGAPDDVGGKESPPPATNPIRAAGAESALSLTVDVSDFEKPQDQLQFEKSKKTAEGKIGKLRSLNLPIPEKIIGKKINKKNSDGSEKSSWVGGYLNSDQGFSINSFDSSDFSKQDIKNLLERGEFSKELRGIMFNTGYEASIELGKFGKIGVDFAMANRGGIYEDNEEYVEKYDTIIDALIDNPDKYSQKDRDKAIKTVALFTPIVLHRLADAGN